MLTIEEPLMREDMVILALNLEDIPRHPEVRPQNYPPSGPATPKEPVTMPVDRKIQGCSRRY